MTPSILYADFVDNEDHYGKEYQLITKSFVMVHGTTSFIRAYHAQMLSSHEKALVITHLLMETGMILIMTALRYIFILLDQ